MQQRHRSGVVARPVHQQPAKKMSNRQREWLQEALKVKFSDRLEFDDVDENDDRMCLKLFWLRTVIKLGLTTKTCTVDVAHCTDLMM